MKIISMGQVMYLFVWGEARAGESVETQTSHQLILGSFCLKNKNEIAFLVLSQGQVSKDNHHPKEEHRVFSKREREIFVCGNRKMASDSPPVHMHFLRGLGDKLPRRSVCGTMAMINIKQEALNRREKAIYRVERGELDLRSPMTTCLTLG